MPNLPPVSITNEYARQMQHALVDIGFWKSCLNCEHYNMSPTTPLCNKWNVLPPPEVIVFACEAWRSVIPF